MLVERKFGGSIVRFAVSTSDRARRVGRVAARGTDEPILPRSRLGSRNISWSSSSEKASSDWPNLMAILFAVKSDEMCQRRGLGGIARANNSPPWQTPNECIVRRALASCWAIPLTNDGYRKKRFLHRADNAGPTTGKTWQQ